MDASGNWWGSADASSLTIDNSPAVVDITPLLTTDTDVGDGNPTNGFDGDFSDLTVTTLYEQTGTALRIDEAVTLADNTTRGIVRLEASAFAENATVDRPRITIAGVNIGTAGNDSRTMPESIVDGGTGAALTIEAEDAIVDGIELQGATGVRLNGSTASATGLVVRNNRFRNDRFGADITDITTGTGGITLSDNLVNLTAQFADVDGDPELDVEAPTAGFNLRTIDLATPPSLTNNVFDDTDGDGLTAFYGIIFDGVNGASGTNSGAATISGGTISGTAQAIAILDGEEGQGLVNTTGNQTPDESTFSISNVTLNQFVGDATEVDGGSGNSLPAIDFHAGVFVYTGGSPGTSVTTEGTITNVTVDGTGTAGGNGNPSSGLYFGGFSGEFGDNNFNQSITVDQATLTNNDNRGIFVRGAGVTVNATALSLENNGGNSVTTSGNFGFGVIVRKGADVTVTESTLINPPSGTSSFGAALQSTQDVTLDIDGTTVSPVLTVQSSSVDRNGLGDFTSGDRDIRASENVWLDGSTVVNPFSAPISATTDYSPWSLIGNDADGTTPGFQVDLTDLGVDSGSPVLGGTLPRLEEAIASGGSSGVTLYSTSGEYPVPNPVTFPGIVTVGGNLDFGTAAASLTVPTELVVGPATTITDSPTFVIQNRLEGTAGFGSPRNPGADAGWQMFAFPQSGATGADLADDLDFSQINGSIVYTWDDATQTYTAGDGTSATALDVGRGFFLYFLDDDLDPIEPSNPLVIDADAPLDLSSPYPATAFGIASLDVNLSDVSGVVSAGGGKVHLLGNPYTQSFDLSNLTNSGVALGSNGIFLANAQIWDPDVGVDGDYVTVNVDNSGATDLIAPWQGFWIERQGTATDNAVTVQFNEAGRSQGETFIPNKAGPAPRRGSIELLVSLEDDAGTVVSDDRSMLFFADEATLGSDPYDATAYAPFINENSFVELSFQDPGQATRMLSQMSLPYDFTSRVRIPTQIHGENVSGSARVQALNRTGVPDAWTVFITDTQTGESIALDPGVEYRFDLSATSEPSTRFDVTVSPNGTLPVELASFGGTAEEQRVVLDWTTATETNNAGFRVQQKTSSGYQTLGFVEGAATTSKPQRYNFVVQDLDYGTHTFRLVQVDLDGTATPHPPSDVQVQMTRPFDVSGVAPNPVWQSGEFSVAVRTRQPVQIQVYDVLGRRVSTLHDGDMAPETDHRIRFDASGLASGLYFVRVTGETFTDTRRVVVVR